MGQLTITSPWRLDTLSKGDSHSQGSASGGKLKWVTTCFRQVTKQVGPDCHFHRSGAQLPTPPPARPHPAMGAPRSPALWGAPTQPERSPEEQVGTQEGEQAAQRPLPAQELVGAPAQPQHGLPE